MSDTSPEQRLKIERAALKAEEMRNDILHKALDLFHHYGFSKTNIGDIADCCGMSPGNLYRYFKNKQAIGLCVVEHFFEMKQIQMDTVLMLPEGTAEERIRKFLLEGTSLMSHELQQSPKIVELADFMTSDDEGLKLLFTHIAWKRGRVTQEIQRGVENGELAPCDAEDTARVLLNGMKAFFMPVTLSRWFDPTTILPEMDEILDLLFRGLRAH